MNRKIFLLTLMSVSLCLTPCVAYAAQGETDMYGNPIDWDENGIGNEDDDGSDDTFSEDSLIIPDNEEKSSAPSDETSGGHELKQTFTKRPHLEKKHIQLILSKSVP